MQLRRRWGGGRIPNNRQLTISPSRQKVPAIIISNQKPEDSNLNQSSMFHLKITYFPPNFCQMQIIIFKTNKSLVKRCEFFFSCVRKLEISFFQIRYLTMNLSFNCFVLSFFQGSAAAQRPLIYTRLGPIKLTEQTSYDTICFFLWDLLESTFNLLIIINIKCLILITGLLF